MLSVCQDKGCVEILSTLGSEKSTCNMIWIVIIYNDLEMMLFGRSGVRVKGDAYVSLRKRQSVFKRIL